MKTIPLKIDNCEYPDLHILDQSTPDKIGFSLIKINKGHAQVIARVIACERLLFPEQWSDEEHYRYGSMNCFKKISCVTCDSKSSALVMTNTPIGHVCMDCVAKSNPQIPFKMLEDIEQYVKK